MFTNKTTWQQLLNVILILVMLISTIVIYSSIIDLFTGPKYPMYSHNFRIRAEIQTIINGLIFIIIPGTFLFLTNKFQRRSEKIGVMILDLALICIIIIGFLFIGVIVNNYFFYGMRFESFVSLVLNGLGIIIFPAILYIILIKKYLKA